MFNFFKKKDAATLEDRLEDCLKKNDHAGLAKTCYEIGKDAMEAGDQGKAMLWLSRADTIYSAQDDVYEAVGEKIVDDCSDRIGQLEEAPLLSNQIVEQIEEKTQDMDDAQVRVWSLLTMARLSPLGTRLSALPGCGVLGALDRCVDLVVKSFQEAITQEEFDFIKAVCGDLYDLSDSEAFYAGGEVPTAGAPFQVFDLNGMMGVEQELNSFIDSHLRLIAALSQGVEDPAAAAESDIVGCTLLPDYYVRTGGGRLEEVPQIRAELERIQNDYEFICDGLTWEKVGQRIAAYQALDILAM